MKKVTMKIANDRFVTPPIVVPYQFSKVGVYLPTLDDSSIVYLDAAPRAHNWNYPLSSDTHRFNYPPSVESFAADKVLLEYRFDDADGTTIKDEVNGVTLTEQGNPTFAASAATAGLGKGLTLDGTGDQFDALITADMANFLPSTGDFAAEIVWKGTSLAGGADDTLLAIRNGAAGLGFALLLDANEHLDVHMEDAAGQVTMNTTTDVATDAIQHIGVDFDRDGNCTAYVNGAAVSTAGALTSNLGTVYPGTGAACRIAIGGDANRTATSVVTGTIYFVRVYGKILGAAGWLDNYRILIGNQYPGWAPVYDFVNHVDHQVITSGDDPSFVDLSPYISLTNGAAFRLRCATEQTTTPADLDFYFVFS